MKILVGLSIFNCVIFKDLHSDCYCKNSIFSISKPIFVALNMSREVSVILLWKILPVINIMYTENKWKKKCFFPNIRHSFTTKIVAN